MEKQKIEFRDANNNLFRLEIEIKKSNLSISGEWGHSAGQCQDSIKPKNKEQKRIIEIWNTWHLNDMKAGTEKQEAILKTFKKKNPSFDEQVAFLKSKRIYSDNGYKYGSGWLKRELPKDLEGELNTLCDFIRIQEENIKESLKGGDFKDLAPQVHALALSLEISPKEAEQCITENVSETDLTYCGISYFVGTENEVRERARDYLDEELWKDAVANNNTTDSFEDWQDYIMKMDGFGSILNSWDGSEDIQEVDGITYYIIRT